MLSSDKEQKKKEKMIHFRVCFNTQRQKYKQTQLRVLRENSNGSILVHQSFYAMYRQVNPFTPSIFPLQYFILLAVNSQGTLSLQ